MGRREKVSKELDQLASEIEKDAALAHGRHAPKIVSTRDTHILLEITIPKHAPTGLQIRISTGSIDNSWSS